MQMDKYYIEEHDVIHRYLRCRLNDKELAEFELYILENPAVISAIEREREIMMAFREHEDLLAGAAAKTASGPGIYFKGLAFAASLVVALGIVLNLPQQPPSLAVQPPVLLQSFRGAANQIIQASGRPIVQFQIDMGPAQLIENNAFTANVIDSASGNIAFSAAGLAVDDDGWLYVTLDGQTSPLTGKYEIRVFPDGAPREAAVYSVEFGDP